MRMHVIHARLVHLELVCECFSWHDRFLGHARDLHNNRKSHRRGAEYRKTYTVHPNRVALINPVRMKRKWCGYFRLDLNLKGESGRAHLRGVCVVYMESSTFGDTDNVRCKLIVYEVH